MHRINLDEPEITQPEFYLKIKEEILASIDKAESFNCPDREWFMLNFLAVFVVSVNMKNIE